jgi:four helix bundle suffix protein
MNPPKPASPPAILRPQVNWRNLYFYRKADVLYQLTVAFCRRFLPKHGDRTVDQMVQAARSGKQNIVEGFADGVASAEMELKLINVGRASFRELREDYADFLKARALSVWDAAHPRYAALLDFCRTRNDLADYAPLFDRSDAESLANLALSLCHMTDRLMTKYMEKRAEDFAENGGIRERMTAVRLGRRQTQHEEIAALQAEVASLREENARLKQALQEKTKPQSHSRPPRMPRPS